MNNIKKITSLIMVITLLLFLNGCCDKQVKYVYVKNKCPTLETVDINKTEKEPFDLHVKVKDPEW